MKLNSSVKELPYVGDSYARRLEKLEIETIWDLLTHVPHKYLDFRNQQKIKDLQEGDTVTTSGEVVQIKNVYTKSGKVIQIGKVKDETGVIQVVWFNQKYLAKSLKNVENINLSGKVSTWQNQKALVAPEYEIGEGGSSIHTGRLVPVYPETSGLSSKWLRRRIKDAFSKSKSEIDEFFPKEVLKREGLVNIKNAVQMIHFPETLEESQKGKKRLSFDELIKLQLKGLYKKIEWKKTHAAHRLSVKEGDVKNFVDNLPFELTSAQEKATEEILNDLEKEVPMNRLLEGDVGSGKTVVAAIASFVAFSNGFQTVFMAPTQILAKQHFDTLREALANFKVRTSLVTSGGVEADLGKSDIFVGTHALMHQKAEFDDVALVVIDEQHRFGVKQRALIAEKAGKKRVPHILTMTATPIPRTVALTLYNDLDLSTLDELPEGRKPVTTKVANPEKRGEAYKWIAEKIESKGVQAFVICPLIEESEKETMSQVKAVTTEYERLRKELPDLKISLLHGKMKEKEKNKVLEKFKEGKTDILVSTPVVEVGVDVPNATIMVIEGAERFGLAQLHQLRGRVGRGEEKSYCFLFTEKKSKKAMKRLSSLQKTMSGFELAELDLKLRGPGEVFGTKQHGFTELKIADWQDTELIKKAKRVAQDVVENPSKYKKLRKRLADKQVIPN